MNFKTGQNVSWSISPKKNLSGRVVAKIRAGTPSAKTVAKLAIKYNASVEFDDLYKPLQDDAYIILVNLKKKQVSLHRPRVESLRANMGSGSGRPGRPFKGRATLITGVEIDEIAKLHKSGWSYMDLGRKFGVSYETVRRYLNNGTPKSRKKSGP